MPYGSELRDAGTYRDVDGYMEPDNTDILVMTDRPSGSYIGEVYFPAPYLFDDA